MFCFKILGFVATNMTVISPGYVVQNMNLVTTNEAGQSLRYVVQNIHICSTKTAAKCPTVH